MKKERVLFEQTKSVSTILNVVVASALSIALSGCATSKPETNPENILDLNGTWEQVNAEKEDDVFKAVIQDGVITVSSETGDTETIWWEGSYEIPATSEDKYSWVSEVMTEEKTEGETDEASSDSKAHDTVEEIEAWQDVKTLSFDYEAGILSFVTPVDEETVIELEREKESSKLDYSTAKEFEIKDKDGKVTGKYSVITVNKADVTSDVLEDWYNTYVSKGEYKYAVIIFADNEGKGIYADDKNVYVNVSLSEDEDSGYTKPESDPTYAVEGGKIDVTQEKSEISSNDKTDDKDKSKDKETDRNDETKEDDSKESASTNSGKETSSNTNTSKPSGNSNTGTSNSSKPSGSTSTKPSNNTGTSSGGNQSTNTKPTDPNAGKTKVWVVDTPAWDETVVVTPAWTENVTVVDTPAWDETVVVTPSYDVTTCNNCGAQFTGPNQVFDCIAHMGNVCGGGGYHTDTIPAVTQVVHHEAVTHVEQIYHEAVTQVIHHDEVGHWEWQ